jgi:hypothetical protein
MAYGEVRNVTEMLCRQHQILSIPYRAITSLVTQAGPTSRGAGAPSRLFRGQPVDKPLLPLFARKRLRPDLPTGKVVAE